MIDTTIMTASGVATPTYLDIEKSASITNSPSGLSSRFPFRIKEIDENGELCRIYESRPSVNNSFDTTRLTSHLMPTSKVSLNSVSTVQYLVNVFLPTGYPYSVTPDYFDYQIFDSFQAFSSSIASLFANRAVLSAVGVGDQSASSTSALFMKIVQETIGRLGTIGFAWKFGSALEPECKKYRFMADIFNDSAMVFDCLSPLFPFDKKLVVGMLCMSGLLRSICGVMAGGSRAALTQHFTDPVRGSIADVNAKDQSQETVISLMGMLAGSLVVGVVKGEGVAMWAVVATLLTLHLWTNYRAVSSVVLKSLNRQRANIVFSDIHKSLAELKQTAQVDVNFDMSLSRLLLTPKKVARRENILEPDGAVRNSDGKIIGYAYFDGFETISSNAQNLNISITELVKVTSDWGYIIWYQVLDNKLTRVYITLLDEDNSSSTTGSGDLRAWAHAYLIANAVSSYFSMRGSFEEKYDISDPLALIKTTADTLTTIFDELRITKALKLCGWDLSNRNIISHPVKKVFIEK